MSLFYEAAQRLVYLGDTISINKSLFSVQTRSGHLIQINTKAVGKGYI